MEHDAASKPLAAVKSSLAYGEIRLSLLKEENNDVSGDGNGGVMDFSVFESDFMCNKWTGFLARRTTCAKHQYSHFSWKLLVSPQKEGKGEVGAGLSVSSTQNASGRVLHQQPSKEKPGCDDWLISNLPLITLFLIRH